MSNQDMNEQKQDDTKPVEDTSEDITIEEETEETSPQEKIKKLQQKLKQALAEKQQYLDGWQRERAQFSNLRKQDEKEKKEYAKYAKEELVADLFPVLDSFEMARANKEAWEKVDKQWRMGIEYIQSQLKSALEKNNLVELNPINQKYDPFSHELAGSIETSDKTKNNTVAEVVAKGYGLNDKIIRAPKVKIFEYKDEPHVNDNQTVAS